jgi:hypothetical protein
VVTSHVARGPVFVFTVHRSGGTVLGRVLNCHPDLVIWGEHGGILNKFAEIDAIIARHGRSMTEPEKPWVPEYAASAELRSQMFQPWTTAYDFFRFSRPCKRSDSGDVHGRSGARAALGF